MANLPNTAAPQKAPESKQYDLFTTFFGDPAELSNTLELWDAIPKYSMSRRAQNNLRDSNGRLPFLEHEFEYKNRLLDKPIKARLKIQPALIEEEDGSVKDYYPSYTEDLIEEVLKKIFADQQYGLHFPTKGESWVRFSAHMIRKELAARGHTRSLQEIKKSLEIMAKCSLEVQFSGQGRGLVYNNPILSNMVRTTREDLAEDPNAKWMAQLPALISKGVDELSYRQFNYALHMNLSQLGMWLHKRLVHRYRNASLFHPYTFAFTSVERDSRLLNHVRKTRNIQSVRDALDEIKAKDIIHSWEEDERRSGRQIDDVIFTVYASSDFTDHVKASLARANKGTERIGRR